MFSMKTGKKSILLAVLLVLALVAAGIQVWNGRAISLEHMEELCWQDGQLCLLEQKDGAFRVLSASQTGEVIGIVELPEGKDGAYIRYGSLQMDGAELYLVGIRREIRSDRILGQTVYRVNFQEETLEPRWELEISDPSQVTNLGIQVRDGVLTFFRGDYRGKEAVGRLYRWNPGGTAEEIASFAHDIGEGFTEFCYAQCGTIAFSTPSGKIYTCTTEQNARTEQVFPGEVLEGGLTVFRFDGENTLYAAGVNGLVYRMDLTGAEDITPIFTQNARTQWRQDEVGAMAFDRDGSFAALRKNGGVGIFHQTGDTKLRHLAQPWAALWPRGVLGFAMVWLGAGVLWLLRKGFYLLTRGKLPVVTKLLGVFLPVLMGSMMLMNSLVTGFFTEQMVEEQYEKLYLLTAQELTGFQGSTLKQVDTLGAFEDLYFFQLRSGLNELPKQGVLYDSQGTQEAQRAYTSAYFWLYKVEDGTVKTLVCEQDYVGVPVELKYSATVAREFQRVVQTGKTIRTQFQDEMGTWTVLLTPILDEGGQVIGVMEAGDTQQSLDERVARGVERMSRVNLTAMGILAVLLSGVILYSLHPLRALKDRVIRISGGELGVQAPERSNDEITEIIRAFNTMSRNVAIRDTEIRQTSKGYARFVPERVFTLLEKSSVIDVHLADQTSVTATVLNCSVGSFDRIARDMRSKEMFRFINRVLARLVPVVDDTGGLVDRFDKAGLLAVYTERPEQALDAAVTLCQTVRLLRAEENENWDPEFHVTLSAGSAMIGIVGARERLEAVTISEHTSFSGFLQKLAREQGASILMAASAAEGIPGFTERYHVRTIGFVYRKTLDRAERLYDVYDGEDETTRRLKDETREIFEKGVALYCAREYYEARLLFIQVLKKNRYDKAARNYLYLCDSRYPQENAQAQEVWLEVY